jgi:iron(II)-dependent oxidoreductase
MTTAAQLAEWVRDARERTFELISDLTDEQLWGPSLAIVNPLRWEIGHVAWFQEKWVLRHALGRSPLRGDADALYDSAAIAHDTRWDLPLPSRAETRSYLTEVRDGVLKLLRDRETSEMERYFILLALFHEDMHTEAFTYTRQTHGWPAPRLFGGGRPPTTNQGPTTNDQRPTTNSGRHPALSTTALGDARLPGGTFMLGATPEEPFVFDNEKWAHPVEVQPFGISRTATTQAEFAAFVEEGGYQRRSLWSEAGWRWRESAGAEHPVYWRRSDGWERREFDAWVPLEPNRPVLHVNWYEADAFCRWAGRRLPAEAEWEAAAATEPNAAGTGFASRKRRFPWGDDPPTPERANLDWHGGAARGSLGCVEVDALPAGESAWGCRQMIGNVWEWTASDFLPYPGFEVDPYKEYSEPWFGDHKVLRGGCWVTRSRLLRNTWRNFYKPDRRDVWAGFRTCALAP